MDANFAETLVANMPDAACRREELAGKLQLIEDDDFQYERFPWTPRGGSAATFTLGDEAWLAIALGGSVLASRAAEVNAAVTPTLSRRPEPIRAQRSYGEA